MGEISEKDYRRHVVIMTIDCAYVSLLERVIRRRSRICLSFNCVRFSFITGDLTGFNRLQVLLPCDRVMDRDYVLVTAFSDIHPFRRLRRVHPSVRPAQSPRQTFTFLACMTISPP